MKHILKSSELLRILSIISITSTFFYILFILTYNLVHFFYPPVDKNIINPWHWIALTAGEGLEVPVIFFAQSIYLGLVYFLFQKLSGLRSVGDRSKIWRWLQIASWGPLLFILLHTRSEIFSFSLNPFLNFLTLSVVGCFLFLSFKLYRKRMFVFFLWLVFAAVIFLSVDGAVPFSYSFIIAPALKLTQGETLGSFQIYYGLLLTYLFRTMMVLNFHLQAMEVVLGSIFLFWYFLYFKLASKIIRDKFLVFLFMVALFAFRFLAIRHDPTAFAEVSPLRLELWVPLILIVLRFGFSSIVTSGAFSLAYVVDSFFGFLYLGVYVVMVVGSVVLSRTKSLNLRSFGFHPQDDRKVKRIDADFSLKKLLFLAIPPVLAAAFQIYFFGSLFSPVGHLYQSLRLYFLPISTKSIYWDLVSFLGFFMILILLEVNKQRREILALLLGLALVELMYFYGFSSDHNLLNISGIFLLMIFVSFDYLIKTFFSRKTIYAFACALILFASVAFIRFWTHKLEQVGNRLLSGQFTYIQPVDTQIALKPNLFEKERGEKIFLMSDLDGYYNWRYEIKQVGFEAPYRGQIFMEDTVKFLVGLKNHGYRLILWEPAMFHSLTEFNKSNFLVSQSLQFQARDRGDYLEVDLVSSNGSLVVTEDWKNYKNDLMSFDFPPRWTVDQNGDGLVLSDDLGTFLIYIKNIPANLGTLIEEGSAQIPNFDRADVKVFSDRKMLFTLYKGKKSFEILVFPTDSSKMIQFDDFMKTLVVSL